LANAVENSFLPSLVFLSLFSDKVKNMCDPSAKKGPTITDPCLRQLVCPVYIHAVPGLLPHTPAATSMRFPAHV